VDTEGAAKIIGRNTELEGRYFEAACMQVPLDHEHGRYKMSFRKVYRDVLSVGIACWTNRR
jgi:hypothetical protein